MAGAGPLWLDLGAGILLVGLAIAAVLDVRTREVPDRLWQVLGVLGAIGGAVVLAPEGAVPLLLWVLVVGLALEHMFPWDRDGRGGIGERADLIELVAYVGVSLALAFAFDVGGFAPDGVPPAVAAVFVTIVVARVLFEFGVLYGGADAKALIIAGVLVPLFPVPWVGLPANALLFTSFVPYAVNLLMDAAVLSIVVPLAVAVKNVRRGEFSFRTGFVTYTIPVDDLPRKWVWVRDPVRTTTREEEQAIESSEQDRAWRTKVAEELKERGISRVRVGPQLPFIVLMAGGAVGALLLGNWITDLLAVV